MGSSVGTSLLWFVLTTLDMASPGASPIEVPILADREWVDSVDNLQTVLWSLPTWLLIGFVLGVSLGPCFEVFWASKELAQRVRARPRVRRLVDVLDGF